LFPTPTMSRASAGASFAQFFPSAPRAAKDKAKEREKSKTQNVGSPRIGPDLDTPPVNTGLRFEDVGSIRFAVEKNNTVIEAALPTAEDNESLPGDILNAVGSASSHSTSTVSSVFSAPAQQPNMSTFGGSRNVSSLTPLTNTDSSPSHIASPSQHKAGVQSSIGFAANNTLPHDDISQAQCASSDPNPAEPRVLARDPTRGVKGNKCIYDPLLDRKLSSNDKKKAKPTYKDFGLVRIHNLLGSVILFV
jgi:histone-lysine N-methyltransferase SETD1